MSVLLLNVQEPKGVQFDKDFQKEIMCFLLV